MTVSPITKPKTCVECELRFSNGILSGRLFSESWINCKLFKAEFLNLRDQSHCNKMNKLKHFLPTVHWLNFRSILLQESFWSWIPKQNKCNPSLLFIVLYPPPPPPNAHSRRAWRDVGDAKLLLWASARTFTNLCGARSPEFFTWFLCIKFIRARSDFDDGL